MTKIIVQNFVENLLKVLKTRTALIMNGLAELRVRYAQQSANAQTIREARFKLQISYK